MSLLKSVFAVGAVSSLSLCNPGNGSDDPPDRDPVDPVETDVCDDITTPASGSALRTSFVNAAHNMADAHLWEIGEFKFIFSTFNVYQDRYGWMTGQVCKPVGSDCYVLPTKNWKRRTSSPK